MSASRYYHALSQVPSRNRPICRTLLGELEWRSAHLRELKEAGAPAEGVQPARHAVNSIQSELRDLGFPLR